MQPSQLTSSRQQRVRGCAWRQTRGLARRPPREAPHSRSSSWRRRGTPTCACRCRPPASRRPHSCSWRPGRRQSKQAASLLAGPGPVLPGPLAGQTPTGCVPRPRAWGLGEGWRSLSRAWKHWWCSECVRCSCSEWGRDAGPRRGERGAGVDRWWSVVQASVQVWWWWHRGVQGLVSCLRKAQS